MATYLGYNTGTQGWNDDFQATEDAYFIRVANDNQDEEEAEKEKTIHYEPPPDAPTEYLLPIKQDSTATRQPPLLTFQLARPPPRAAFLFLSAQCPSVFDKSVERRLPGRICP